MMLALAPRVHAQAGPSYNVTVDTSGLMASPTPTGYIFLSFTPDYLSLSPAATATITNFALSGTPIGSPTIDGAVSPPSPTVLPSTFSISNTDPGGANDLVQELTFGTVVTFTVAFSGPAFNPANPATHGSDFTVGLDDTSFNPLLTTDPDGNVLDIAVEGGAGIGAPTYPNVVATTYPASAGQASAAAITLDESAVPEPSTLVPFSVAGLSLLGMMLRARSRRKITDSPQLPA